MGDNWLNIIVIYGLIIGVMYFLFMRPQQKKQKAINSMRESLKTGDKIITIGGIYGTIISIKEDYINIEVGADKVKLKIAKWAVGSIEKTEKEEKK